MDSAYKPPATTTINATFSGADLGGCKSGCGPAPSRSHTLFTHNFVTQHTLFISLSHTTLPHTQLSHTTLSHTLSLTHNFVAHHFSHTTLSHTLFHTQLCHTPSFTHIFVTHDLSSHTALSQTIFHTHNFVTHSLSHTQLCRTLSFAHHFVKDSLSHTTLSHTLFHTQLCHTPSFTHNCTSRHPPSLCVAGVALHDIHLHFAWQEWHLRHWAGSGGVLRRGTLRARRGTWRKRGTWRHRFAWQAWHLATSTFVLHGRRGASRHPTFGLAPVARLDAVGRAVMPRHFAWQAWHLATPTFTLHGRRGTWRHPVALGGIHLRFAWQAWHFGHWAGSSGALGAVGRAVKPWHFAWQAWHLATSTFPLRGRRGTWRHSHLLCVAGVATFVLRGKCGTL